LLNRFFFKLIGIGEKNNLSIETFESIKKPSFREIGQFEREVEKKLRGEVNHSALYGVMVAVYEGINTREKIYDYFKYFYTSDSSYIKFKPSYLDEIIQTGVSDGLIQEINGLFSLSDSGRDILIKGRKILLAKARGAKWVMSERFALISSLICLVLMSSLKILIGMSSGSDALFNEGIENFTDIIKVFIISLSMKFSKDKLGSIVIILLMLFTGINLVISSIFSLINGEIIIPDVYAFFLMLVSISLNFLLMNLKAIVGKNSGNFSLLSDAKDNSFNMRLSTGVIIGLTFAIFKIYFIDSLVAIFISSLVIYDGIVTLKELIKSGDNIEIDAFKLHLEEMIDNRISYWLLATIQEDGLPKAELNQKFIESVEKGHSVYDFFAILGFYNVTKNGAIRIINALENDALIIEENNKTSLTHKGIECLNKGSAEESKKVARDLKQQSHGKFGCVCCIFIIVATIFLFIYGPMINDFLAGI